MRFSLVGIDCKKNIKDIETMWKECWLMDKLVSLSQLQKVVKSLVDKLKEHIEEQKETTALVRASTNAGTQCGFILTNSGLHFSTHFLITGNLKDNLYGEFSLYKLYNDKNSVLIKDIYNESSIPYTVKKINDYEVLFLFTLEPWSAVTCMSTLKMKNIKAINGDDVIPEGTSELEKKYVE